MNLLQSPWESQFNRLIENATESLAISSPYIGAGPCSRIVDVLKDKSVKRFSFTLLTDLSRDNMISGSTDVPALLSLFDAFPRTVLRFLPSLHAKIYVADQREAVITSSNLTDSGLCRNFEYGVHFDDSETVCRIRQDLLDYVALGSPVDCDQLRSFARIVEQLRDLQQEVKKSARAKLRHEFERRLRLAETDVLRTRAAGRSPNAIFSDCILYLLRIGPASTQSLHNRVQQIHPDLCNEAEDRIIDGRHFGKRWKHAVRTAQQHLKDEGLIELTDGRWRLRR